MIHGHFNDLPWRTVSNKVLPDKAFNNAKNPKYDTYLCGITSMAYKPYYKKSSATRN